MAWNYLELVLEAGYNTAATQSCQSKIDSTHQTVLYSTSTRTTTTSDGDMVVIQPGEGIDGEVDSNMEVTR